MLFKRKSLSERGKSLKKVSGNFIAKIPKTGITQPEERRGDKVTEEEAYMEDVDKAE